MDLIERREHLKTLSKAISNHLPAWQLQFDEDNTDRVFFTKGAMKFGISLMWDKARLHIQTWTWPQYVKFERGEPRNETVFPNSLYDPPEPSIDITISADKEPQRIARDIERRFLTEYERIWERCKKKADAAGTHESQAKANWEAVCKIINKPAKSNMHYLDVGKTHMEVENRDGEAYVKCYLTAPQLRSVIELLKSTLSNVKAG